MKTDFSPKNIIFEEELIPLLKERLAAGQKVRYLPFRGRSMLPMLRQGKDAVELGAVPKTLCKYDLPVYQYPSGKYVMHRVIKVMPDHYICRGDNTYTDEFIRHGQMIAVVTAFMRGDRRISVDAPGYKLYCRIWCAVYPLRRLAKRAKGWLGRHLK